MAATKIDENTVICVMSHCNPKMVGEVVVLEQEFPADHPVVKAAPTLFMPKGTPRQLWPHEESYAIAANDANSAELEEERKAAYDRTAAANKVKFEQPKFVRLKKQLVTEVDGVPTTIERGSMLPANHEVVERFPEAFAA